VRCRVLLSEASSLTAREFVTVLGRHGVQVEAMTASSLPLARFSRWCRAVHHAPAPSADPVGYLQAVDSLMASGRFDALLPTHEQAWMFAVGRSLLTHAPIAVASAEAFDQVASKIAFATVADTIGLPQPAWRRVGDEPDLGGLGFPVWIKASFSTAGRGVYRAADHAQAIDAWRALSAAGADEVMIQSPAQGCYAQVQGLFADGELIAAAASEQLALGAGGSAAARVSVDHPLAVDALARLGAPLGWRGGIALDYLHRDGRPQFIECNPRIVEPGNAAAAGVDFPQLMIDLATGRGPLPARRIVARAGVRTRSSMAIGLGAAETDRTRRAVLAAVARTVARRGPLHRSSEVLTPVLADPASVIPFLVATGLVLARPANVTRLAGHAVNNYAVTPTAIDQTRRALNA
jgi:hypothetical protein